MEINKNNIDEIFENHFANEDAKLNAILKAHMLIEIALNQILEILLGGKSVSKKLDLKFHQKIQLARTLTDFPKGFVFWNIIIKLNEARNKFAHTIEPEIRTQKVKQFRSQFQSLYFALNPKVDKEEFMKATDVQVIGTALKIILNFLVILRDKDDIKLPFKFPFNTRR